MATNLYANATQAPPARFRCDHQPYGPFVIEDCRWGDYNGYPTLTGRVVDGTETARIGGCHSTKSIIGGYRTIYGVKAREIETGQCVRIAM